MKPISFFVAALLAAGHVQTAQAASVYCTNCGNEVTQLVNKVQLVSQYAMQANQYAEQLAQTQMMLTNLARNPVGVLMPDLMKLAGDEAKLISMGFDIASNVQKAVSTFDNLVKNPAGGLFSDQYKTWTKTGQDALRAALLNAGIQRERFADDRTALEALVQAAAKADGNLAALNALSAINARQVYESQQLRDLISQQNAAINTHLATQIEKEQAVQDNTTKIWSVENKPIPKPRAKKPGNF